MDSHLVLELLIQFPHGLERLLKHLLLSLERAYLCLQLHEPPPCLLHLTSILLTFLSQQISPVLSLVTRDLHTPSLLGCTVTILECLGALFPRLVEVGLQLLHARLVPAFLRLNLLKFMLEGIRRRSR